MAKEPIPKIRETRARLVYAARNPHRSLDTPEERKAFLAGVRAGYTEGYQDGYNRRDDEVMAALA